MDHPRVGTLPPLLPGVGQQFDGVGNVPDRRVEPHVEHFALGPFNRHGHTPVEVPAHGPGLQPAVEPALALAVHVGLPLLVAFQDPFPQPRFVFIERQIPMLRALLHWFRAAHLGVRIDQFLGAQRGTALLTLVAIGVGVAATGAGAHDIAIGQEHLRLGIVELFRLFLDEFAFFVELAEEFGGVLVVRGRSRPGIGIEGDAEIGERLFDERMVFVDDILRGASLLAGRNGNRHAVLVGAAHEKRLPPAHAQIADIDVRGNIDAGQMADVDRTVGVRQGASNEIPFFHNLFNSFESLFFTVLKTCSRATSSRSVSVAPSRCACVISRAVAAHCSSVMRSL